MDEKSFVSFLKERFPFSRGCGIGDDASTTPFNDGFQVITKDLFIERVHFSLDYFTPEQAAHKSLAVNLSDIAAMGGRPAYFYLGFAYPRAHGMLTMTRYFEGLAEACRRWNVELAGGDFSSADQWMISITAVGYAEKPVYRHGAQTGHLIGVTGPTGGSALGLKLLQKGVAPSHPFAAAHLNIEPHIAEGLKLAPIAGAMMDVSDGLIMDLQRILDASEKGAVIHADQLPCAPGFRQTCQEHDCDFLQLLLAGGEDYVLLFTTPPENRKIIENQIPNAAFLGEITSHPGLTILYDGRPVSLNNTGYDHFGVHKHS